MDYVKNIEKGFTEKELSSDVEGAIGGLLYVMIPTLLEEYGGDVIKSDWVKFAAGVLGGMIVGKALKRAGISRGAIGAGAAHLLYAKGQKQVKDLIGRELWTFGGKTMGDPDPDVESYILPSGETVEVNSISDYLPEGEVGINDYVNTVEIWNEDNFKFSE